MILQRNAMELIHSRAKRWHTCEGMPLLAGKPLLALHYALVIGMIDVDSGRPQRPTADQACGESDLFMRLRSSPVYMQHRS